MPVDRDFILLSLLRGFLHHALIHRSDGCTFAGDFGGYALGNFAGGAIVDEHVEFGLSLNVDKTWRNNQTRGGDALSGGRVMQIADGCDAVAEDSDIANKPRRAGAIDDAGPSNHKVVLRLLRA